MTPARADGSATVLATLALLVVFAVATAVWSTAQEQYAAARSTQEAVQVEAAAEAAIVRLRSGVGVARRTLALGATASLGGQSIGPWARGQATVRRAGRELYLLEGRGTHARSGVTARVGYVMWALDPVARFGASGAALSVGGRSQTGSGGQITGAGVHHVMPGWEAVCAQTRLAADSVAPSGTIAPVAVDTTTALRLGALDHASLASASQAHVSGTVTPAPTTSAGGCLLTDSHNWGDPSRLGACADHRPLIYSPGDLHMAGGAGQGVLVVAGDLTLTAGAHFAGVVLVGGRLRVVGGSTLEGQGRVGSDVWVGPGQVFGRSCPALLALAGRALQTVVPLPHAWVDPI